MGVDCNLWLPHDVKPRDIHAALQALLCHPVEGGPHLAPEGEASSVSPMMLNLELSDEAQSYARAMQLRGERWNLSPSIHLFGRCKDGSAVGSLMLARANPRWIAVARRLAQFFGGEVVANDCNEDDPERFNRACPVDAHGLIPDGSNEDNWDAYLAALLELEPLSAAEVKAAHAVASYLPDGGRQ